MKRSLAVGALGVFLLLLGGNVSAQEEPDPPWALSFTHGDLDTYSLTYKDGSAKTFYYLTFTLANHTKVDAPTHVVIKALVGSDPRKQKLMIALPAPDAEEALRRLSRTPDLKNVQEINALGTLKAGQTVKGIAVFGTFHREWDIADVTVAGLEPYARECRVRKYGDVGFTVFHRAYYDHNRRVLAKAGADAAFEDVHAIVRHNVVWKMKFHRKGDEFAPQVDRIFLDEEGWEVADPGPEIVFEPKPPFRG